MINEGQWKTIYNDVFNVFPVPSSIPLIIKVNTEDGIKTFTSSSELIAFLCLNKSHEYKRDDIEYILTDSKLRSTIDREIHNLEDKIKERV